MVIAQALVEGRGQSGEVAVGKDGEREAEDPGLPTAQPLAGMTWYDSSVPAVPHCLNLH